jgi:hypothetical protein
MTMSKQETAMVQLLKYILVDCRNENGVIQFNAHETFNKFLEMEKEQIIKAHGNRRHRYIKQGMDIYESMTGEEYYNEIYES